jgi:hypothetical protein
MRTSSEQAREPMVSSSVTFCRKTRTVPSVLQRDAWVTPVQKVDTREAFDWNTRMLDFKPAIVSSNNILEWKILSKNEHRTKLVVLVRLPQSINSCIIT